MRLDFCYTMRPQPPYLEYIWHEADLIPMLCVTCVVEIKLWSCLEDVAL